MRHIHRLNTAFILIIVVLSIISASEEHDINNSSDTSANISGFPSPKTANAAVDVAVATCFAADTFVTLASQKQIPISELRPGDELLASNGFTIFTAQHMMFLDKNRISKAMFHTITTESENSVSLSPLHLIPVVSIDNAIKYVAAQEVRIGDLVYVMSNGTLVSSKVVDVVIETKTGYFAPLTTSGTLLVNEILASSYANVRSHETAHFYMAPLRWYYSLTQWLSINEPFGCEKADGIHIIPRVMYEIGRLFQLSALQFS